MAGDVDAEDGEGVVKGVVLGDGGPVEDYGRGPDSYGVEKRGWRLLGEERFADDENGGVGNADVLLGAALE